MQNIKYKLFINKFILYLICDIIILNEVTMRNYKTTIKYLSVAIFVLYLSYLIYLTFFDDYYGRDVIHRSINIVPFRTIIKFLFSSYNWNVVLINIVGNIAAFVPMGFLLPIAFERLKTLLRVILVALSATMSIEIFQYITGVGASDIDDVILNVLGGIMGYFMMRIVAKLAAL